MVCVSIWDRIGRHYVLECPVFKAHMAGRLLLLNLGFNDSQNFDEFRF